ncbi:MAG: hypothetical protein WA133_07280 [Syntrophales bacterium]
MNQEEKRLDAQKLGKEDWRLWGPYLSERAWGTVREKLPNEFRHRINGRQNGG